MDKKKDNAVTGWDFRWNKDDLRPEEIAHFLDGIAKKYVFQLEEGDNGYLHYQGRMSLIKKRRKTEKHLLLGLFDTPPNYLAPTLTSQHIAGDAFYLMKKDTRKSGPWTDKDEVTVLTKQLVYFIDYDLYPYQKRIYEECQIWDWRKINLIYDPRGMCGKSIFCEWLEYKGLVEEIPPWRLMDNIFQWVYCRPTKQCYIVDMPRGMKKEHLSDFYSGIEVVKNGVAYDGRYKGRKKRFNRPRIFVFTNTLPNFDLMTKDRWVVWKITPDYDIELSLNDKCLID